uniref:Uncharacterized protein n=1 Tax=Oryza brachyantha TaxID=4533 RepID=J3N5S5_ORYBR
HCFVFTRVGRFSCLGLAKYLIVAFDIRRSFRCSHVAHHRFVCSLLLSLAS